MRYFVQAFVATLALACAGCGFYLKGERPLSPEMTELHARFPAGYQVIQTRFEEFLRAQLQQRGVRLVEPEGARSRLNVYRIQEENRVLSVGPTGKSIEYELLATVEFDYYVADKIRLPRQSLTVLREYSFDDNRVLAKQAARRQLQREMHEELADLVLLKIEAALANPPPEEIPAAEPAG